MPELPEVELVLRYLRPHLLGRRIDRATTTKPSDFFLTAPRTLAQGLRGRRIQQLVRRGKYLLAQLDDASSLLMHLGMTGQLILAGAHSVRLVAAKGRRPTTAEFTPDEHTHLTLHFDDSGPDLHFRDTRKFGKVRLLRPNQAEPRLEKLGPDALEITGAELTRSAAKRRTRLKSLLLDQQVLAGVGNIYADEALHLARLDPLRPADSVAPAEFALLAKIIRQLLRRSIRAGGSSIDDYVHPDGSDGQFQSNFNVYGRTGQPCHNCGNAVARIVLGGRATHFCSHCQT